MRRCTLLLGFLLLCSAVCAHGSGSKLMPAWGMVPKAQLIKTCRDIVDYSVSNHVLGSTFGQGSIQPKCLDVLKKVKTQQKIIKRGMASQIMDACEEFSGRVEEAVESKWLSDKYSKKEDTSVLSSKPSTDKLQAAGIRFCGLFASEDSQTTNTPILQYLPEDSAANICTQALANALIQPEEGMGQAELLRKKLRFACRDVAGELLGSYGVSTLAAESMCESFNNAVLRQVDVPSGEEGLTIEDPAAYCLAGKEGVKSEPAVPEYPPEPVHEEAATPEPSSAPAVTHPASNPPATLPHAEAAHDAAQDTTAAPHAEDTHVNARLGNKQRVVDGKPWLHDPAANFGHIHQWGEKVLGAAPLEPVAAEQLPKPKPPKSVTTLVSDWIFGTKTEGSTPARTPAKVENEGPMFLRPEVDGREPMLNLRAVNGGLVVNTLQLVTMNEPN